ncbi:hypothetical protein [Streptomyces sp. MS2.AVA.5]|uniref:Uncharacterized protein n=1 Tax=Streptomyces achmelvichensis TaxID=3134111 RepID=A0ACC6PKX6_9ACTN
MLVSSSDSAGPPFNACPPVRPFGYQRPYGRVPLTWDMGSFAGPATLTSTAGVDTEVVVASLPGFAPGEQVSFTGVDADLTSTNPGPGLSQFAGGATGLPEFEGETSGTLRAVLSK